MEQTEHSSGSTERHHRSRRSKRRRNRQRPADPSKKVALILLVLVLGSAGAFVLRRMYYRWVRLSNPMETMGEQVIQPARLRIQIFNISDEDWPSGLATINGEYTTHFPPMPKHSVISLNYTDFHKGRENFATNIYGVNEIKVQPEGKPVMSRKVPH